MRRAREESETAVVLADELPLVVLPDDVDIDGDLLAEPVDDVEEELIDGRVLEEVEDEISLEEDGYEGGLSALRIYNVIGWFVLVGLSILFIVGWSYYQLPVVKRPFHYLPDAGRPLADPEPLNALVCLDVDEELAAPLRGTEQRGVLHR